jgi:hypothetical protein
MAEEVEPNPVLRFFTRFCVVILTIFAITSIAIYTETRKFANRYPADERVSWLGPDHFTLMGQTSLWPKGILYSADRLVLAASIWALFAGIGGMLSSFISGREIFFALPGVISLGTSMGALIHSMDWHSKYGRVSSHGALYDIAHELSTTWTLERWTCEFKDFVAEPDTARDYAQMCKDSVSLLV